MAPSETPTSAEPLECCHPNSPRGSVAIPRLACVARLFQLSKEQRINLLTPFTRPRLRGLQFAFCENGEPESAECDSRGELKGRQSIDTRAHTHTDARKLARTALRNNLSQSEELCFGLRVYASEAKHCETLLQQLLKRSCRNNASETKKLEAKKLYPGPAGANSLASLLARSQRMRLFLAEKRKCAKVYYCITFSSGLGGHWQHAGA